MDGRDKPDKPGHDASTISGRYAAFSFSRTERMTFSAIWRGMRM